MEIEVVFSIHNPARNSERMLDKVRGRFINLITRTKDLACNGQRNLIPAYFGSKACNRTVESVAFGFCLFRRNL